MTYDWNKPLLPGTVICSKYNNFNGEETVGVFMVLYDEQTDSSIIEEKNVLALKLSTKGTLLSNYSVQIDRRLNNFLNDDCIACCSKIHILHKQKQIYKVIGQLHPATYHKVFKIYNKFNNEVMSQLINNI